MIVEDGREIRVIINLFYKTKYNNYGETAKH